MRLSAREGDETSKAKIRMSVGMLLGCVYRVIQQSREDREKKHARDGTHTRVKSLMDAAADTPTFFFRFSIDRKRSWIVAFPSGVISSQHRPIVDSSLRLFAVARSQISRVRRVLFSTENRPRPRGPFRNRGAGMRRESVAGSSANRNVASSFTTRLGRRD